MHASQANRARIAARAGVRRNPGTPATDPAARVLRVAPIGNVRRARSARMTGAQRNSLGQRSEWVESPYYRTSATIDARWSDTVSTF